MRHGGYSPFDDDDNDDDDVPEDGDHTAANEAFGGFIGFGGFGEQATEEAREFVPPVRRARPAPRPGRARHRAGPGQAERPDAHAPHAPYAPRTPRTPRAPHSAAPPGADGQRPHTPMPNPTLPSERADPGERPDPAEETLSAVARDLWRAGMDWVGSIHRPLLVRLAGVLVVLAVVMALCASVLQASLHPTPTTTTTTRSTLASSSSATTAPTISAATGGRFTGTVAVSYWAGHKLPFTSSVTVTATLSWATTHPATFSCGNFTVTFSGYNRPQNITCQLTLPTGADGVNAEQFQRCASLHDPNATTLCWDNPAQFRRA